MGGVYSLIFMLIIIMMLKWIGLMFSLMVIGYRIGVMISMMVDGFIIMLMFSSRRFIISRKLILFRFRLMI